MEKEQLPNSTLILVFGILSILGCCCYGILGIIFGVIALILGSKATKLYKADPAQYSGHGNVTAGKALSIIGIVLSLLYIAFIAWIYLTFGLETMQDPEALQQAIEEMMGQ